ncbi:MAG: hypothetical protein EGR36_09490 [Eubacterium ventriosum]|nr:hypothetical protein [Eubacterium ventriosum]
MEREIIPVSGTLLETKEKLKKAYSGAKHLQSMLLCVVGGRVWMVWWRVVPREMAKVKYRGTFWTKRSATKQQ